MASRGLGTLTLDLVAKIGGFEAGMDKAARHADKRMREIERRAYAFGKALGASLKVAAGIAATGFGLYLKNTIEAEKVQAQLTARIKDTGGAAGQSLKSLNDMADAMQRATVFDDEAIGGVQAMLLTFKDIRGDNFRAATEAVLDLSTAMGTDLNSSALQVGKALQDPVKGISALSRAGVQFTDAQKAVIKSLVETGDKAGAQKIILDELAGQMGTAAEAARDTLGGALRALKNSFDNLLEGDTADGGLKGTRDAVESLNDSLNDPDIKRGIDNIASSVAGLTAQMLEGIGAIQRFSSNLQAIGSISDKVAAGAPASAFTDRELEIRLANLSEQKSKARKGGDLAEVDRLQKEITGLIRDNTRRLKEGLFDNVVGAASTVPAGGTPKTPEPRGTNSGNSPRAAQLSEEQKEAQRLLETYQQLQDNYNQQIALVGQTSDVAKLRYDLENGELAKLNPQQKELLLTLAQTAEQRQADYDQLQKTIELEDRQRENTANVLSDIQAQNDLLGKSAEYQDTYNKLKYAGVDANSAFGQSIIAANQALHQHADLINSQIDAMDGLRDASRGFLHDLRDGAGIWDSLKNAADNFAATLFDIIAQNLVKRALGEDGTSGGGGYGDIIGSLFGAFFGGGGGFGGAGSPLANGGPINPNLFHEVGENDRPEMLMRGGKQYLIPGNKGRVVPFAGGSGVSQNLNFYYAAPPDPRTQSQTAQRVAFETSRASKRNR